ncbi:MAG: hypothetical protein ACREDT_15680 [Methylocella sp.]
MDFVISDDLHHKDWLPVADPLADTVFHIAAASLYFGIGDEKDAFGELFNEVWDKNIQIWKQTTGLNEDVDGYILTLVKEGDLDWKTLQKAHDISKSDPAAAAHLIGLVVSGEAANSDNVTELWNQLSITLSSTKRPLVAWNIILGLVHAKEAEIEKHDNLAKFFVGQVKSDVNWPRWVGIALFGFDLKEFANSVAKEYTLTSWAVLKTSPI